MRIWINRMFQVNWHQLMRKFLGLALVCCCTFAQIFLTVSMWSDTLLLTVPTMKSMTVLKHVVSCLDCHEDVCRSLKWQGHAAGIFHKYPSVSAMETLVEVYTDSDWACDKSTRGSVSGATIFWGCCLLYSSSRTQKLVVSLSSGEAEVYSCSSGGFGVRLCTSKVGRLCRSDGWSSVHVFVVCFCHCISVT